MHSRIVFVLPCLLAVAAATAADIEVKPGPGAISGAAAIAKSGDTIRLAPGEYVDAVVLGEGVTLMGSGADSTTITGAAFAVINCAGANVRIVGVEILAGPETVRGVNTSQSVRVERCRFKGVREAVAMMEAPLSDVVFCEFVECGIGVRAIGGASPTVWGCTFSGGRMGVFGMDGAPYIRNNLFVGVGTGVRLISDEAAIVRNNVFWKCEEAGIDLKSKREAVFAPSIRNNIFSVCSAAVIAEAALAAGTSHAIVHEVKEPAFRNEAGERVVGEAAAIKIVDPGLELADDGELKWGAAVSDAKGIRLNNEPAETVGTIGLAGLTRPGCKAEGEIPRVRFSGPIYIANSVREEYMAIRSWGMSLGRQTMKVENGIRLDSMEVAGAGKDKIVKFDIDRFFAESGLTP